MVLQTPNWWKLQYLTWYHMYCLAADRWDFALLGLLDLSAALIWLTMRFSLIVFRHHSQSVEKIYHIYYPSFYSRLKLWVLTRNSQQNQQLFVAYHKVVSQDLCYFCCLQPAWSEPFAIMESPYTRMPVTHRFPNTPASSCAANILLMTACI